MQGKGGAGRREALQWGAVVVRGWLGGGGRLSSGVPS